MTTLNIRPIHQVRIITSSKCSIYNVVSYETPWLGLIRIPLSDLVLYGTPQPNITASSLHQKRPKKRSVCWACPPHHPCCSCCPPWRSWRWHPPCQGFAHRHSQGDLNTNVTELPVNPPKFFRKGYHPPTLSLWEGGRWRESACRRDVDGLRSRGQLNLRSRGQLIWGKGLERFWLESLLSRFDLGRQALSSHSFQEPPFHPSMTSPLASPSDPHLSKANPALSPSFLYQLWPKVRLKCYSALNCKILSFLNIEKEPNDGNCI